MQGGHVSPFDGDADQLLSSKAPHELERTAIKIVAHRGVLGQRTDGRAKRSRPAPSGHAQWPRSTRQVRVPNHQYKAGSAWRSSTARPATTRFQALLRPTRSPASQGTMS